MNIYLYKGNLPGNSNDRETLIIRALNLYDDGIKDIVIERGKKGRPFLKDGSVFFSVSHSGDIWCCAVSENRIGIDIQKITDTDVLKLAERYFAEPEFMYIKKNGHEAFFDIWTRKEAYVKYTGKGLSTGLDTFLTSSENRLYESVDDKGKYFYREVFISPEMKCTICTADKNEDIGDIIWMD